MKATKTLLVGALALVSLAFASCSKKEQNEPPTSEPGQQSTSAPFHISLAVGSGNPSSTFVQGVDQVSSGVISAKGHRLESSRTARIFPSSDGKTIWYLNYTVGDIYKEKYLGGDKYEEVGKVSAEAILNVKAVRMTKLSDKEASIHYISASPQMDGTEYKGHNMLLTIGILNLETMTFDLNKTLVASPVSLPAELKAQGYYVSRIDAPVLSDGKLYYGCAVNKANPAKPNDRRSVLTPELTMTLVVDYNDLSKAEFIYTSHVWGSSNGYRMTSQSRLSDGSVLATVSGDQANGKKEVHLAKIKNGRYDTSFDFNLSEKLGKSTSSLGFFNAGSGILYMPYEDLDGDKTQIGTDPQGNPQMSASWGIARIDLNKGTAIDLEVPANLWLRQYQDAVVRDGKFYIALNPVGANGHVYIFDVKSEARQGVKGAELQGAGADQYFVGIY